MSAQITTGIMTLADVPAVLAIEQACFTAPWSEQALVREMTENACARYVVAREEGEAIAYAGMWMVLDEAQITNVAVREDRRRILGRMMSFIRKADFSYACFALDKKFLSGDTALHDILLQQLVRFLVENANDFNSYAHLKIYYDDGQPEVKSLLREAFAMYASRTEFVGEVHPENYRLFQAADTLCTLELMRLKLKSGERLSRSEFEFFNGIQNLNRNYFKPIDQKRHR